MIEGSCLCGSVKFQIQKILSPMEICHCTRCRKQSGAGSATTVEVLREDFSFIEGEELINSYSAPILYSEPAYQSHFCKQCGSPVPPANSHRTHIEIPAGLFDNDPGVQPDKHIFVELVPSWDNIADDLPQYKISELMKLRYDRELPKDFELKSHYEAK
jgi:hypothetical protein